MTWASDWLQDKGLSWQEKLRKIAVDARAAQERTERKPRLPDPWEARLADLKGEVNDGHERMPAFVVFDHLGLRRSERHSDGPAAGAGDAAPWMGEGALSAEVGFVSAGAGLSACRGE